MARSKGFAFSRQNSETGAQNTAAPASATSLKRSNSARQSRNSTTFVANSSDIEGEFIGGDTRIERTLQAVHIPVMARQKVTARKASDTNSPTDTTMTSLDDSTRATSLDLDTPGTTPGPFVAVASGSKRKRSSLGRKVFKIEETESDDDLVFGQRQRSSLGNKAVENEESEDDDLVFSQRERSSLGNKAVENEESEDDDLVFARALQAEEYGEYAAPNKKARTSAFIVDDTDDGSKLSEPESFDSLDIKPMRRPSVKSKLTSSKAKEEPKSSKKKSKLPARPARDSARKSLSKTRKFAVDDSELSELSELDSLDEFRDETEAVSTGVSDTESDIPLFARHAPVSAPKRRRPAGARPHRFGNHTASDAEDMADNIDDIVRRSMMTRKERERKKLERSHPGIKTMWDDLRKIEVIKPVAAAQPASINRQLKSFQLEGLDWMIRQEKTDYKGGLLGDEMGMGKTIQAVSLIMSDYPQKEPTLVLVPPVALMQWSAEITDYTDGKLKVLVYHGQNAKIKGMSVRELKKYDVIMISYNSLESLHRKETKGWSRGEDIIKEDSPIHAIYFHRLILDEAHSIKSRTTGVAKACFALKGKYKWCLSGTPVQNRIGEFFSLLRFLEVRPFADYFCKSCDCSMLHWKLDDDHRCAHCKHSGMEHVSVFNQELLNPLTQSEDPEDRSAAMDKLHLITARIMLRRMKRDYTSSMELPMKEITIKNQFFGLIERDFAGSLMGNTSRQFDNYVARGVVLNNYANIFGLLMKMRQCADHPDLIVRRAVEGGQNVLVCNICDEVAEDAIRSQCKHDFCRSCVKSYLSSTEDASGDIDCPRCHIPLAIDLDQPEMEQDEEGVKKSSIINRIKMTDWTSSTKIEMLVYELYKLRSKKQTLKSIVFSQFTSMLQLIEWRLRRAGFNTVMLDGSMTPIQRQRSIEYFMNTPECEVFLVSLKAGGVALNLVEASQVFIVDPWWNPAAEWQSADRCHRIGQRRPVQIQRLTVEDSVESRIVMLQEKKANMINGTMNGDKSAMEKLTPEDLSFLFRQS